MSPDAGLKKAPNPAVYATTGFLLILFYLVLVLFSAPDYYLASSVLGALLPVHGDENFLETLLLGNPRWYYGEHVLILGIGRACFLFGLWLSLRSFWLSHRGERSWRVYSASGFALLIVLLNGAALVFLPAIIRCG